MSAFSQEQLLATTRPDVNASGHDVVTHFRERGFRISDSPAPGGGWSFVIRKGGFFTSLVGFTMGIRIQLWARPEGLLVRIAKPVLASRIAMILGMVTAAVLIPVISWGIVVVPLTLHIWGLTRQAALDDEALGICQDGVSLRDRLTPLAGGQPFGGPALGAPAFAAPSSGLPSGTSPSAGPSTQFCTGCGNRLDGASPFCGRCGKAH